MDFIAGHVTKTGLVGGAIYFSTQFGQAIIHHSWDAALGALGYGGLLLALWGTTNTTKKVGEIVVSSEASRIIDSTTQNSSPVPAVQREIEKQQRQSSG
jgi:hypothetical protein